MFLLPILIPACNSSSPAFLMMCSAYGLSKQGDNRQLWCIPSSISSQSVVPYRFLRRQVRWSGIPISLRAFQFVMIHTDKGFTIVNKTEIDVFLKFPCFLCNPLNVGNLISSSSSFSKPSVDICKSLVCIILKPSMQDFKHDLTSMEMCVIVQWLEHSLVPNFLGIGMRIDLFQSCGLVFQIC